MIWQLYILLPLLLLVRRSLFVETCRSKLCFKAEVWRCFAVDVNCGKIFRQLFVLLYCPFPATRGRNVILVPEVLPLLSTYPVVLILLCHSYLSFRLSVRSSNESSVILVRQPPTGIPPKNCIHWHRCLQSSFSRDSVGN
jgi:hypothetical protein